MYSVPVELWLNNRLKSRIAMKPAVDAKQLRNTAEGAAC